MISSPVYTDRVKVFALSNWVLFALFQFVFAFTPGAWLCGLLGAAVAVWYRAAGARLVQRGTVQQPGASG